MRNYKSYLTGIAIFVIFMSGLLTNPQKVGSEQRWLGAWIGHLKAKKRLIVPIPPDKNWRQLQQEGYSIVREDQEYYWPVDENEYKQYYRGRTPSQQVKDKSKELRTIISKIMPAILFYEDQMKNFDKKLKNYSDEWNKIDPYEANQYIRQLRNYFNLNMTLGHWELLDKLAECYNRCFMQYAKLKDKNKLLYCLWDKEGSCKRTFDAKRASFDNRIRRIQILDK